MADVLHIELIAPQAETGTACGAAILAMVGVGAYSSSEAAFRIESRDRDNTDRTNNKVQPQASPIYEAAFQRYKQLYEALKSVRVQISA